MKRWSAGAGCALDKVTSEPQEELRALHVNSWIVLLLVATCCVVIAALEWHIRSSVTQALPH